MILNNLAGRSCQAAEAQLLSFGWSSGLCRTRVRLGGRARLRSKHRVGDDHAGAKLGLDFGVALAPALVHLTAHRFWEDVVVPSLDTGERRARDFARTRLWPIDAFGHVPESRPM